MDKIISEFKVIETDDGFRVEIKGNREAIRQMFKGGRRHFFKGREHFGPGFWGRFGWRGPWEESEEASA